MTRYFVSSYELLGAHPAKQCRKHGYIFRVWAPRAESVSVVVGDEDIATVSYRRVSDCYIYYNVEARKAGTTTVYIETADGAVKSMPINISVIAKGTLSEEEPLTGFFVNTNSKNFHKANCSVVDSIKDENKAYYDCEREELIEAGYSPCKTCNP